MALTTAGAASALGMSDATASPIAVNDAAPTSNTTTSCGIPALSNWTS